MVHRLWPGAKLLALAAFSLTVVLTRSMPASFVFLGVALVAAGRGPRAARRVGQGDARGARDRRGGLGRSSGGGTAATRPSRRFVDLVALTLMAVVVSTSTTPVNAMLDTFVRALGPARRIGVDPERVALTIGLAIQALPGTVALALETRDAARARGLGGTRAPTSRRSSSGSWPGRTRPATRCTRAGSATSWERHRTSSGSVPKTAE